MRRDNHDGKRRPTVPLCRKNRSPSAHGEALIMKGYSFPTAEMAEFYGKKVAREWIDENVE